ncbi:MAG TPA: DUF1801 domain-containing protein [Vicinamibacterales bacterium]
MIRKAATVSEYLSSLPPDERADIRKVRAVIRKNLPKGYQETVQWGMICYTVPLSRYSETYNGQALCYAAIAAHKNYHSLHLMNVYGDPATGKWFRTACKASGKRLDMGKSCVHFRQADDLPLEVIGEAVARTSVDDYILTYEKSRPATKARARKAGKKKK